jgi:hypothetical protein
MAFSRFTTTVGSRSNPELHDKFEQLNLTQLDPTAPSRFDSTVVDANEQHGPEVYTVDKTGMTHRTFPPTFVTQAYPTTTTAPITSAPTHLCGQSVHVRKFTGVGEDAKSWIPLYELTAMANKWNDTDKFTRLISVLDGPALETFLSEQKAGLVTNWSDVKTQLLAYYSSSHNPLLARAKLYERVLTDKKDLEKYFADKIKFIDEIDPHMSEQEKVTHILLGLDTKTQQEILKRETQPRDIRELIQTARTIIDAQAVVDQRRRIFNRQEPNQVRMARNAFVVPVRDNDSSNWRRNNQFNDRRPNNWINNRNQFQNNRNQFQNNRNQFQNNRATNSNQRPTVYPRTSDGRPICNNCNQPGHIARFCPNSPGNSNQTSPKHLN